MIYLLRKRFTFSASHQLDGLPADHQCTRLHGHNYAVTVELTGRTLDKAGMLLDLTDLGQFRDYLDTFLDHRHLNDVLSESPTVERLAAYLLDVATQMWPGLANAVDVQETETSWARAQH
jgi:6-pyruvoyltetrahydropterin/6-carboxytetrahydropterin synthase